MAHLLMETQSGVKRIRLEYVTRYYEENTNLVILNNHVVC